jgi:hypothetical protein
MRDIDIPASMALTMMPSDRQERRDGLREAILGCDEEHRRLAWSIVDGPYSHHHGAAEVLAEDDGRARFVWTADLRPDTLAEATAHAMEQGLAAIKRTLERP